MSIIDAKKTIGKMSVPLRGPRDDSRHQTDVGEAANHPGVGNFIEFINFAIRERNQTLEHHLKTSSRWGEICIKNYTKPSFNLLL